MPQALRAELDTLAGQASLPVSEYCREVLTAYYFGARQASGFD